MKTWLILRLDAVKSALSSCLLGWVMIDLRYRLPWWWMWALRIDCFPESGSFWHCPSLALTRMVNCVEDGLTCSFPAISFPNQSGGETYLKRQSFQITELETSKWASLYFFTSRSVDSSTYLYRHHGMTTVQCKNSRSSYHLPLPSATNDLDIISESMKSLHHYTDSLFSRIPTLIAYLPNHE